MNKFYKEDWFKKLFIVLCVLVLLVGFGMRNLLVLLLPFICMGVFLVLKMPKKDEDDVLKCMFLALIFAPFLAAFIVVALSNPQNMWFDTYTNGQWVTVFTGVLIYTGTMTLSFIAFWQNKKLREVSIKDDIKKNIMTLSFVTLYPKDGKKVEHLPLPAEQEHHKQWVIPINTKTDWIKIPCHLKNESDLPVVAVGLEALNDDIKGTKRIDHALLIPSHNTVGVVLYIPAINAKIVDIKCEFTNVLGKKTQGVLHFSQSGESYKGIYNLSIIQ
ncbi:MAG: hypothetical protein RR579_05855 [Eubacterium sp.]